MNNIRHLVVSVLSVFTVYALAYTTGACQTEYPSCDISRNGSPCNNGNDTISFGDEEPVGIYYCGGNTAGRCGGPSASGTCSELLYRPGKARKVYCGDNFLGYCNSELGAPENTGHDCGLQPCDDVPAGERQTPNIVGPSAPCNVPHGTPCLQFPSPPSGD
jgi:hypothetical protein